MGEDDDSDGMCSINLTSKICLDSGYGPCCIRHRGLRASPGRLGDAVQRAWHIQ